MFRKPLAALITSLLLALVAGYFVTGHLRLLSARQAGCLEVDR